MCILYRFLSGVLLWLLSYTAYADTLTTLNKAVSLVGASLSPEDAVQVAEIVDSVFETEDNKAAFIALLAAESRFNKDAISHAGAVGMAQVMPQYVNSFLQTCPQPSPPRTKGELSWQVLVTAGACHFLSLTERYQGNLTLSIAAYNAGVNSKMIKRIQTLAPVHMYTETANHIIRVRYIHEEISP